MAASILTAEYLRSVLNYDAETGIFTWRVRPSNRVQIGGIAGTLNRFTGYASVSVGGKLYRAHRLAWLYVTGKWPEHDVDHINGVRTDNMFSNLRDITRSVNLQNQRKARSNNKSSGLLGVSWAAHRNKWRAIIKIGGINKQLGYRESKEDAHQLYLAAKRQHHEGCTI